MSAFFTVFSPEGETPPKVTHPTHKEAFSAAWWMAKKHPGQTFFVMRSVSAPCAASGMEAGTGETEGLDPKDDSPVPHVDEADARNVSRNLSSNNSRKV